LTIRSINDDKRNQHFKGIKMTDSDTKEQPPAHVVSGSGEYARIKTDTKPLTGKMGIQ